MTVGIIPLRGIPEVEPGDDLAALLAASLHDGGIALEDGDVVAVTQKVVSKAEGRIVPEGPEGKARWIDRETQRVVARRGDLVIVETHHGFVCANAGVDASNVMEGSLTLLPKDPDRSAEGIRAALAAWSGAAVSVVITDTFGRPWREGLVNVAIGCAGLPSLVDLRGTKDARGRVLESTVQALADEVAAASGLVMGKADGIPAAVIRGLHAEGSPLPASALTRRPEDDLFRESAFQALLSLEQATAFAPEDVDPQVVVDALLAAGAALRSGPTQPWRFIEVHPGEPRERLVAAAVGPAKELLAAAPVVIVGLAGPTDSRTMEKAGDSDDLDAAMLTAGAALQNVALAFHAFGLGSAWIPPAMLRDEEVRRALGIVGGPIVTGAIAAGRPLPPS